MSLILMSILLLMLAGCSSDDDNITVNDKNIFGWWESEATIDNRGGLMFLSDDGEIKQWEYSAVTGNGEYHEWHWGYFWFDDEGTLHLKYGTKEPNPDEMYYKVTSLTKDRMVIRSYGGFAATPFEEGHDRVYIKVPFIQTMKFSN